MSLEWQMSDKQHCCEQMVESLKFDCSQHADAFECPDTLVYYSDRFDEYGLIVHDGGASYVSISHCPWCGDKLPESRRDEWFGRLEALGFINPAEENIPDEFQTGEWHRQESGEG